jgi:hypothetical protein
MRACANELAKIPSNRLKPGPLKGLLFGNARRFMNDLVMMLRVRAGFLVLRAATDHAANVRGALDEFVTSTKTWQRQHDYENSLRWGGLDEVLRKLNSPEVNAYLDNRFNPFVPPKLLPGETPFECVARELRDEETSTLQLLRALQAAQREVH